MDDDEETCSCEAAARRGSACDRTGVAAVHIEVVDPWGLVTDAERRTLSERLGAAVVAAQGGGEVRVRLVRDAEMSDAHARYGGEEGTTDVLTFDMRDERGVEPSSGALDVDIWACVDEARRQAAARGHGVDVELLLYCLHGVLHCLGHDDHDPAGFERMHAEEDRILQGIGVGRVYASGAGEGQG
jgi:probable rRNA maturation factor